MDTKGKLKENVQRLLRCPICKSNLAIADCQFKCLNERCRGTFPTIDGIPILINESSSVFSIDDFLDRRFTFSRRRPRSLQFISDLLPEIGCNLKAQTNYQQFAELLSRENENPIVLVVGGSVVGIGIQSLLEDSRVECIESDVSFGPRTSLICDAHDLPFDSNSLDGVIMQAVLEHVVDPYRCVEEAHRVLKPKGLVYAETAFMQQVHGRYDFTRFTNLGHRRLFRGFNEISSGASGGTGMALAWAYRAFILSFVKSRTARVFVTAFVRLTAFWLKYFDYYLIDKRGTLDAASAYYFMGRKSNRVLSDQELIELYRGRSTYRQSGEA